jgi:hypothetical protein
MRNWRLMSWPVAAALVTLPLVAMQFVSELVNRRWSWPGQYKKCVYNFCAEGREFSSRRCLTLTDGFLKFNLSAQGASASADGWLEKK